MKTWDPKPLVLVQETSGKTKNWGNSVHPMLGSSQRSVSARVTKSFLCPSRSLAAILSADLPSSSSRKAILGAVLLGSGQCGQPNWRWLGWSLLVAAAGSPLPAQRAGSSYHSHRLLREAGSRRPPVHSGHLPVQPGRTDQCIQPAKEHPPVEARPRRLSPAEPRVLLIHQANTQTLKAREWSMTAEVWFN